MPRRREYEEYYEEEQAFETPEEENVLLKNTPWWAISVAFHAIVLLMVWSIVLSKVADDDDKSYQAGVDNEEFVEPPQIPPPPIKEDKEVDPIEDPDNPEDLTEQEDPTEKPDEDRRPNPNPSNVEGPYPEKGYNSSLGLGGNLGGGGGPGGGGGGFRYRRERPKNRDTDKNVLLALYWLRDHQDQQNGNWSCDNFIEQCRTNGSLPFKPKFDREGVCSSKDGSSDIGWKMGTGGVTGLSTLAFLGAGYTHEEGEFKLTVKKALRYIQGIQSDDGCFGSKEDEHYVYNHSILAMAMAEAYAMTAVAKLKAPAQMAVNFIAYAQNEDPDRGWLGWRYGVKTGENDGSVTGWMVLALKSARAAQLKVPERCWDGAKRLYDDLTSNPDEEEGVTGAYPRTGYLTKGGPNARLKEASNFIPNPSIDAINVLCRLFMGESRSNNMLKQQAKLMTEEREGNLPTIDNADKIDFYYWYYASLAIFQMGDPYWSKWEKPMIDCLTNLQRLEDEHSCVYGSWDPEDAWGIAGGRVYATAINALTLEVYYRYEFLGTGSDK